MNETISTRVIVEDVRDKKGKMLAQKEYVTEITFNCNKIYKKSYFIIRSMSGNEARYGEKKETKNKKRGATQINLLTGEIS